MSSRIHEKRHKFTLLSKNLKGMNWQNFRNILCVLVNCEEHNKHLSKIFPDSILILFLLVKNFHEQCASHSYQYWSMNGSYGHCGAAKTSQKTYVNMMTIHWYLIKMSWVGIFSLSIKMMQKILMGCISQKFWTIIENIYSIAIAIPISYVHIHLAGLCNVV